MKLLRMRMMMKPYICLIGGGGGGGGVLSQQLRSPSSSKHEHEHEHKHKHKPKHKHIKVIKPDGVVSIFNCPIKACEVMNEYPKHMVCRSDSFYIGQIIPHLSQQDKLERGHTYFLLPSHIFHSVLSFVTIASFASSPDQRKSSDPALVKKVASGGGRRSPSLPAFDIQKTTSGSLRIRVSEVFISQLIMEQQQEEEEEQEKNKDQLLCTTPQLHKDYKQLVMGSRVRHWKPKLEMISEHKKRKTLLSSASFSINTRRKPSTTKQMPSLPPPTKCQSTCKLRRFKLKLRGLTTTTNSPTYRYPKSRKQH